MISPNEYFDEIYCLNLERRQDRWQKALSRFKREGIIVNRVLAIDGQTEDIILQFKNLCRNVPNNSLKTVGAYAILLTYIKLYRDILDRKQNKVLIFEDDILFYKEFEYLFNKQVENIPDNWMMWSLAVSQFGWDTIEFTENRLFYKPKSPNRTYGLFAHAIKKEYIEEILPKLETMLKPADVDIYLRHDIYISNPFICAHDYGYSDNTNCLVNVDLANKPGYTHRLIDKENYW